MQDYPVTKIPDYICGMQYEGNTLLMKKLQPTPQQVFMVFIWGLSAASDFWMGFATFDMVCIG